MKILLLLFLALTLVASPSHHKKLKEVSLQLVWLDQFQFAGYYMAKEKGFYKDAGFDVELKKFDYDIDTLKEVSEGRATYGVGRPSIIKYDSSGKDVVLLAAILQSSPNILLALKSSGISKIKDFRNKRLMQTMDLVESVSFGALIKSKGLENLSVTMVEHTFNINDLIDGKVDLYSGYISNEPYILEEKGIPYTIFTPKEEGFDFYSDLLFTSQKYLEKNYDEVGVFKEASLRGWEYAFEHIEESVDLILEKYNPQNKSRDSLIFEAKELKKLAYYKTKKLGHIDEDKIQRTYDIYKILGLIEHPLALGKLIYHGSKIHFTKEEREYISTHHKVKFCTQPKSMPYSAIQNGKFTGVGSGILNLITNESGIEFSLVETATWEESITKAVRRECDILPLTIHSKSREKYFNFTAPYYSEPVVIVTKIGENYILDLGSVLDQTFVVMKSNSFSENIKKLYPSIKLHEVATIEEAFDGVESGKYFAYIEIMMRVAYAMQHDSKVNLKIAGQFEKNIEVSFAIRNDDPILTAILQKAVSSLKKEDIQKALNTWISVNYVKEGGAWYFKEIGILFFIIMLFLLLRAYYLKKDNKELENLQNQLLELNSNLESKVDAATLDLEKAQEVANIGSWIYDIQTAELRWSKQTYKIFAIPQEVKENLFEVFQSRIHPDNKKSVVEAYEKSLKNRKNYSSRHKILLPDGSIKYVNEKAETTFDEEGNPLISYGTVQDVTHRVEIEQELKRKDASLLYQSRLAQMGEMMSMIAHQWKQPLSAISSTQITMQTAIQLEIYDLAQEEQREEFLAFTNERLDKIALYVKNLSQTIQNFSEYYRPNKKPQEYNIDKIIENSYDLVRDSINSSGISISFDLSSKSIIKVYENELMQVVLNLLTNASQQLKNKDIAEPKIEVVSSEDDKEVRLSVRDNAGGIPQEIISKVFDPYFSTKTEKNGTGLGLYMSRMIVEQHHEGKIEAHNSDKGAVFTITISKEKEENE